MTRTLVATDLSPASNEAVRQAHAHATATHGALAVGHVVPDIRGIHLPLPAPDEQPMVQNARILESPWRFVR